MDASSRPPTLRFLEPEFAASFSHQYAWARALALAAQRRGYRVEMLTALHIEHSVIDEFAGLGIAVLPTFSAYPPLAPRVVKQGVGAENYWRGLRYLYQQARPGDVALTMSGTIEYGAVAASAAARRELPCPLVMQFFTWDHFTPQTVATRILHRGFKAGAVAAMRHAKSASFLPVGQTRAIANFIGSQLGRSVASLPFPLDWSVLGRPPREEREPVVGYLGSARAEKGFPAFVDGVTAATPTPSIFAQTFRIPGDEDPAHPGRVERLRACGATIVDHGLRGAAFAEAFARVDVLVLPYRAAEYAHRNSSLLAEALGLGRVVVAPRGTWLGATLELEGLGVTYEAGRSDGLKRAIEDAVIRHDELRDAAEAAAERWRIEHSPDGYVDRLLQIVSREGEPTSS